MDLLGSVMSFFSTGTGGIQHIIDYKQTLDKKQTRILLLNFIFKIILKTQFYEMKEELNGY